MSTAAGGRDWIAVGTGRVGGWVRLLFVVARLQFRLSEVEVGALVFRLSVGWFGSSSSSHLEAGSACNDQPGPLPRALLFLWGCFLLHVKQAG